MWASRALVTRLSNPDSPISLDLSLDWRVLGFTAAVAVLTTMVFGIRPAFRATRGAPIDALKNPVRTGGERLGVSSALIVAQVALSMLLLVTAALLVRTFTRLAGTPLGFDSERVLVIAVDTARAQPGELPPDTRIEYQQLLVDRIAAAPGVAHAAGSTITPLGPGSNSPINQNPETLLQHWITPGWLSVYGMPLRAGRDFTRDDRAARAAGRDRERRLRPEVPVGVHGARSPSTSGPCRRNPCTIVGVVGDAVYGSIRGGMRPTIYVPLAQSAGLGLPGRTSVKISVRSATSSPASLTAALGAVLRDADPNLTFSFQPVQGAVNQSIAQDRIVATLSAFFGGLALLLSALGLYGVTSYAVSRRRAEIGIRLALGASRRAVLKLVLFRISLLIGAGLAAGTAISLWAATFLAALLFEVNPRETARAADSGADSRRGRSLRRLGARASRHADRSRRSAQDSLGADSSHIDEPLPMLDRRQRAGLVPAKDSIAIPRDQVVEEIEHWRRQNAGGGQTSPHPAHALENEERAASLGQQHAR